MSSHDVRISGIRVRNLEDVSLHFRQGEIVLFTGLSGSGKTSLAFDTVYALGLHRYLATLPSFFVQTLSPLPPPSVQSCIGLSPTVAIRQNYFSYHNQTSVGTTTQISHYLALLFSLEGEMRDPDTHAPLDLTSKEAIIALLLAVPNQTPITLLAPITHKQPSDIQRYVQEGYTKVRVDGILSPIYTFLQTGIPQDSEAWILVDHIIKQESNHARLKMSLTTTLEVGEGRCTLLFDDQEQTFNTSVYNPQTQQTYTPLTFQDFSPHGAHSRCISCQGSGLHVTLDPNHISPYRTLLEGCCSLPKKTLPSMYRELCQAFADHMHIDISTPWEELSPMVQHTYLYGDGHLILPVFLFDPFAMKKTISYKLWKGILNDVGEKIRYAAHPHKYLSEGLTTQTCPTCHGTGLKALAVAATWQGKHYHEFQMMPLSDIYDFLNTVPLSLATKDILETLRYRLSILIDLGLPYLTPHRSLATLSSGEQERTALAKHIGSKLTGITYILDEPSIGLHPKDIEKLTQVIVKLRNQGNTILLVEHEDRMISIADRIIDVGPEAGIYGGKIQFNGSPRQFLQQSHSLTAQYLRQERTLTLPARCPPPTSWLHIHNANVHNLKNISLKIPLERITAITGASGSGKSSLINDFLVPQVHRYLHREPNHLNISHGCLEHLVHVTRELPSKTQRSIPLTYLKAFDALRQLFANQPLSKRLGLTKAHFSFNLPVGACSECKGLGSVLTDHHIYITCSTCLGQRFQSHVLEVLYRGKTISDILNMTAQEGALFFLEEPSLHTPIQALCSLGLHYLPLGRPLFSLSGGEIQRMKLALDLLYPHPTPTLYVLDEPSTGLHTHDLQVLINAFSKLIDYGHTVILIEHNMHLVQVADHIVELGPEGGEQGGELLASCSLSTFLTKETPTAIALRQCIQGSIPPLSSPASSKPSATITVHDAHHHNLKHLDLSIPNRAFSVIAGPSASGKHSLLFHVLYAYGNITYSEIFPPYLRQPLIQKTPTPRVSAIQGLAPVVAVHTTTRLSHSKYTVASALDIASPLATLFATYGLPYSPHSQEPLVKMNPENLSQFIFTHHPHTPVTITIPIHDYQNLEQCIQEYVAKGFVKLFANRTFYDLDDELPKQLEYPSLVVQHISDPETYTGELFSALCLACASSTHIRLLFHKPEKILFHTFAKGWMDAQGSGLPPITKHFFSPYHHEGQCPSCLGTGEDVSLQPCQPCSATGMHPYTHWIRIEGTSIVDLYKEDIGYLQDFLCSLPPSYDHPAIQEILTKISHAHRIGLSHLIIGQKQHTLSRGELSRLHIAKILSSQLTDVVYLFEDPLSGTHHQDQPPLIQLLKDLVAQSNTVIATDRTRALIPHADHRIYLGPQSGPLGGELLGSKSLENESLETKPLDHKREVLPKHSTSHYLHVSFDTHHQKHIDLSLPLGALVTVIGVSGAGKTTLLKEGIHTCASAYLEQHTTPFSQVLYLDATPLTASKRSDLGSYFDITPTLRLFYASLATAKALNISSAMFSPNTKQGQCSECSGIGYRVIDRAFHAMETIPCSTCSGFRIQPLSLEVTYQNKHFGQILQTPIQDLPALFPFLKKIQIPIQTLINMGLGYLPLGQSFSSLSMSEKACIKIIKNLSQKQPTLFLLDESTVFLDPKQKTLIYGLFSQMIHAGHSIVIIDNDTSFLRYADHLLELGPGAGKYGGEITFLGSPDSYSL